MAQQQDKRTDERKRLFDHSENGSFNHSSQRPQSAFPTEEPLPDRWLRQPLLTPAVVPVSSSGSIDGHPRTNPLPHSQSSPALRDNNRRTPTPPPKAGSNLSIVLPGGYQTGSEAGSSGRFNPDELNSPLGTPARPASNLRTTPPHGAISRQGPIHVSRNSYGALSSTTGNRTPRRTTPPPTDLTRNVTRHQAGGSFGSSSDLDNHLTTPRGTPPPWESDRDQLMSRDRSSSSEQEDKERSAPNGDIPVVDPIPTPLVMLRSITEERSQDLIGAPSNHPTPQLTTRRVGAQGSKLAPPTEEESETSFPYEFSTYGGPTPYVPSPSSSEQNFTNSHVLRSLNPQNFLSSNTSSSSISYNTFGQRSSLSFPSFLRYSHPQDFSSQEPGTEKKHSSPRALPPDLLQTLQANLGSETGFVSLQIQESKQESRAFLMSPYGGTVELTAFPINAERTPPQRPEAASLPPPRCCTPGMLTETHWMFLVSSYLATSRNFAGGYLLLRMILRAITGAIHKDSVKEPYTIYPFMLATLAWGWVAIQGPLSQTRGKLEKSVEKMRELYRAGTLFSSLRLPAPLTLPAVCALVQMGNEFVTTMLTEDFHLSKQGSPLEISLWTLSIGTLLGNIPLYIFEQLNYDLSAGFTDEDLANNKHRVRFWQVVNFIGAWLAVTPNIISAMTFARLYLTNDSSPSAVNEAWEWIFGITAGYAFAIMNASSISTIRKHRRLESSQPSHISLTNSEYGWLLFYTLAASSPTIAFSIQTNFEGDYTQPLTRFLVACGVWGAGYNLTTKYESLLTKKKGEKAKALENKTTQTPAPEQAPRRGFCTRVSDALSSFFGSSVNPPNAGYQPVEGTNAIAPPPNNNPPQPEESRCSIM